MEWNKRGIATIMNCAEAESDIYVVPLLAIIQCLLRDGYFFSGQQSKGMIEFLKKDTAVF